jgi:hypothetical protein
MTPDGRAASKTLQRLRSRISMPIAALAWTGFPYIRKSRQGKSVPWVSVSAGTSRFERRPCARGGTVCYYGTGIHDGKLGQTPIGSLARAREIRVNFDDFGTRTHVPDAGRETIDRALKKSGVRYNTRCIQPSMHLLGEGPRFDPEATDLAPGDDSFTAVFLS